MTNDPPSDEADDSRRAELDALRAEVAQLRQTKADLEIALQTTAEHGDAIEEQLQDEIVERQRAEAALQSLVEVVLKKNVDLEIVLQMTAEHGDIIETELRRANQAKTEFLSNISHELRTPLNAIIGFAQLLRHESEEGSEQRRNLSTILRSGEHLLNLINDVLSLSKIESGKLTLTNQTFSSGQMFTSVNEMMRGRAKAKGLELLVERSPTVPEMLVGDVGRLRQILVNLVGNAIKFTSKGSVIVSASWTNGRGFFEVRDSGEGISSEEQARLFVPFSQTESGMKAAEGTGLGLVITRDLVRLMGGDIEVTSEVGVGSTFRFDIELPAAPAHESVRSEFHVTGLAPGQPVPRVLVIDDDADHRTLLESMLGVVGFRVYTASNGKEGIAFWQSKKPDVVLLDIRMPEMGGDEVARTIRQLESDLRLARTPIIAISARVFEADRALMADAGCDDFLAKPFRESEIFERIADRLDIHYEFGESGTPDEEKGLSKSRYRQLPNWWRRQFQNAVEIGDVAEIGELLDKLDTHDEALVQALRTAAKSFDYQGIEELWHSGGSVDTPNR